MPAPGLGDVNASWIAWAKRPWVNGLKIFVKYSLASVGRSLASRLIVSVSPRQKAQNKGTIHRMPQFFVQRGSPTIYMVSRTPTS